MVSSFKATGTAIAITRATQAADGAAGLAHCDKHMHLERKLKSCLQTPSNGADRDDGFDLRPIALDHPGIAAPASTHLLDEFCPTKITGTTFSTL